MQRQRDGLRGSACYRFRKKPLKGTPVIHDAHCLEDGLLIMTASGNVLRTLMPLNIEDADLDRGLEILARTVRAVG